MVNAAETLLQAQQDAGTGLLGNDPFGNLGTYHGLFGHLPARVSSLPGQVQGQGTNAPALTGIPPGSLPTPPPVAPTLTTPTDPTQTGGTPQSWATIAQGFGPSTQTQAAIAQTAANTGANAPLGSQFSYGPMPTTTTTGGGGSAIVIIVAVAIVALLAYLHFRKHHHVEATA